MSLIEQLKDDPNYEYDNRKISRQIDPIHDVLNEKQTVTIPTFLEVPTKRGLLFFDSEDVEVNIRTIRTATSEDISCIRGSFHVPYLAIRLTSSNICGKDWWTLNGYSLSEDGHCSFEMDGKRVRRKIPEGTGKLWNTGLTFKSKDDEMERMLSIYYPPHTELTYVPVSQNAQFGNTVVVIDN